MSRAADAAAVGGGVVIVAALAVPGMALWRFLLVFALVATVRYLASPRP